MEKKKIALVNQRYGLEVNGGSEYYTRLIAEHLSNDYQVDVLTSKALSYENWANYYKQNHEVINNVKVHRFPVRHERNIRVMNVLGKLITKYRINRKWVGDVWVRAQGPLVPDLVRYIQDHKEEYTAIIFVTYLYYPTVFGLPKAKEKAIFIPTAHDEPYIHFQSHAVLFNLPRAIVYLTDEEKELVNRLYHNEQIPSIVAGVGVDVPTGVDNEMFREKYNLTGDYLIYTGRVDQSKGCQEMFSFFIEYQKERNSDITLVVMGQQFMDIPETPAVRYLGFVSEEDKYNGVAGAKALWLPSSFESLSISVLEAMALNVPVLVNGKCDVLKGHCQKSGGGLYYEEYESCKKALNRILNSPEDREQMAVKAGEYIREYYSWSKIISEIEALIEEIDTV